MPKNVMMNRPPNQEADENGHHVEAASTCLLVAPLVALPLGDGEKHRHRRQWTDYRQQSDEGTEKDAP
jgi:hypothetical protein